MCLSNGHHKTNIYCIYMTSHAHTNKAILVVTRNIACSLFWVYRFHWFNSGRFIYVCSLIVQRLSVCSLIFRFVSVCSLILSRYASLHFIFFISRNTKIRSLLFLKSNISITCHRFLSILSLIFKKKEENSFIMINLQYPADAND